MVGDTKVVLVVDDEEELRDALGQKLESAGFRVIKAADGKEGLAIALQQKPDLILLDVIMPHMDGFEMLKALRENEVGKDVKVMLLTVLDDVGSLSKAIEARGYEYLVKTDWKLDEVVKKVQEKLQQ